MVSSSNCRRKLATRSVRRIAVSAVVICAPRFRRPRDIAAIVSAMSRARFGAYAGVFLAFACSSAGSGGPAADGGPSGGAGGSGATGGASSGKCKAIEYDGDIPVLEAGCRCGEGADSSAPNYPKQCTAQNVGQRSVCCKSDTTCSCYAARCGPSTIDGECVCGTAMSLTHELPSCTSSGSTCCKTDSGYCYCRDGSCGFGSFQIPTCEAADADLVCGYEGDAVQACE